MPSTESLAESADPLLRQLRLRSGLTLRTLAGRAGITAGYLSRVERGRQSAPPETLERIAREIGKHRAEQQRVAS